MSTKCVCTSQQCELPESHDESVEGDKVQHGSAVPLNPVICEELMVGELGYESFEGDQVVQQAAAFDLVCEELIVGELGHESFEGDHVVQQAAAFDVVCEEVGDVHAGSVEGEVQCHAPSSVVCEELGVLIMARLPVRDVVRTITLCKTWSACLQAAVNSKYFRRMQLEIGVTDWYFPTSSVGGSKALTNGLEVGAWVGLHHSSSIVQNLPSFSFLPFNLASTIMVAAAGGLVCFQELPPDFDPFATYVRQLELTYDFIVCNPLTRKWRRLPSITPIAEDLLLTLAMYLVVDEENSCQDYNFFLFGRETSWKFSSSQDTWERRDHHSCKSAETTDNLDYVTEFISQQGINCTIFQGRLYCVTSTARRLETIHQLDLQTLTWLDDLVCLGPGAAATANTDRQLPNVRWREYEFIRSIAPGNFLCPQLVVCGSTLFAVLPIMEYKPKNPLAPVSRTFTIDNVRKEHRLRMRFMIYKLHQMEDQPASCCSVFGFHTEMPDDMDVPPGPTYFRTSSTPGCQTRFTCAAKDGKIWIATAKELIIYDENSNSWKTKPLLDPRLTCQPEKTFPHAYLHNGFPMELNFIAIP